MSVTLSVKDILAKHVVLETEGIDRLYLNGYVPKLQMTEGVVGFFRRHRAAKFASSTLMDPMTKQFVDAIEQLARAEDVPLITFAKGERKDDIAAKMRKDFDRDEGVYFIGKAQERATIYRTEKRRYVNSGVTYPWLVRSSGMVNHYYFYIVDRDFGPLFIKFCSYFPFNAKICLNGHEWLKRQLAQRGIAFEALDNGLLHVQIRRRPRSYVTGSTPRRSMLSLGSGLLDCRIPSQPRTAKLDTATTSPSSRPSSH